MINLWENAKLLSVETGKAIVGGFDVGFERNVTDDVKDALMDFVYWAEDHYAMPVTLWVDFRYCHYLIGSNKKRTGYRFYWIDYDTLSSFENFDDIPVIELAVRCEKQSTEDVLKAFVEAVTHYFAWLSGMNMHTFKPDRALTEEILQTYYNTKR